MGWETNLWKTLGLQLIVEFGSDKNARFFPGRTTLFVTCFLKCGDYCRDFDKGVHCEPWLSRVNPKRGWLEDFEFFLFIRRRGNFPVSLFVNRSLDVPFRETRQRVFIVCRHGVRVFIYCIILPLDSGINTVL